MQRKFPPLFIVLVVLLVSLACQAATGGANTANNGNEAPPVADSSQEGAEPAAVEAPPLAEGWERYEVPEEGFSIALPPTWKKIDMDPETMSASIEEVRAQNPALAESLTAQAQSLAQSGIKFYGMDLDPDVVATGFTPNVNVLTQDMGSEVSLDMFAQVNQGQMENMEGVEDPITVEDANLSLGPAKRMSYNMSMNLPDNPNSLLHFVQYFLVKGTDAYVVTFTLPSDQQDKYSPIADQIAASMQWLP